MSALGGALLLTAAPLSAANLDSAAEQSVFVAHTSGASLYFDFFLTGSRIGVEVDFFSPGLQTLDVSSVPEMVSLTIEDASGAPVARQPIPEERAPSKDASSSIEGQRFFHPTIEDWGYAKLRPGTYRFSFRLRPALLQRLNASGFRFNETSEQRIEVADTYGGIGSWGFPPPAGWTVSANPRSFSGGACAFPLLAVSPDELRRETFTVHCGASYKILVEDMRSPNGEPVAMSIDRDEPCGKLHAHRFEYEHDGAQEVALVLETGSGTTLLARYLRPIGYPASEPALSALEEPCESARREGSGGGDGSSRL
jgi:hypothetical protein